MGDTPRTDYEARYVSPRYGACESPQYGSYEVVPVDFSRELERENAELRDQLAECRKDAERYRAIKQNPHLFAVVRMDNYSSYTIDPDDLDDEIDSAIEQEKQ